MDDDGTGVCGGDGEEFGDDLGVRCTAAATPLIFTLGNLSRIDSWAGASSSSSSCTSSFISPQDTITLVASGTGRAINES